MRKVLHLLEFAFERSQLNENEKYFCHCINCLNVRRQVLHDTRKHFLCDDIKKNYTT